MKEAERRFRVAQGEVLAAPHDASTRLAALLPNDGCPLVEKAYARLCADFAPRTAGLDSAPC